MLLDRHVATHEDRAISARRDPIGKQILRQRYARSCLLAIGSENAYLYPWLEDHCVPFLAEDDHQLRP